ncbi:MAG: phosphoglucosamine mutase [Clostridia bacterium]|nr:phosphoglucosamine mutase [Clostridia bacterium]
MGHFGTDGIRKKADAFTEEYLYQIADGIASLGGQKILIGLDPRESGPRIARHLTERLLFDGVDVIDVGMVPTPCLSYLTKAYGADYGVMLSASHNPPEYNGVKLFSSDGSKASEGEERTVEAVIDGQKSYTPTKRGTYLSEPEGYRKYLSFLLNKVAPDLSGLTVALDCANGATSIIAPEVFLRAGAKVIAYNTETDGKNINCGCGAMVPEFIAKKSTDPSVDIAFCFDGDGDRVMTAKGGKVYDGDKMMYLCAKDMKSRGALAGDVVVGTVMSNMGTEVAMKKAGITLIRADVGDKYVSREMKKGGYNVGGEQSGHMIFADYAPTGDGILSGLLVAALAKRVDIAEYDDIVDYPAINDCIMCTEEQKARFFAREKEIREYVSRLTDCRTVVRPSGTEPKVRILAEAPTEQVAIKRAREIKKFIEEMIL